ncbi:MAG: hypothetical protein IJH59_04850 [Firmicutes bacterium]|nr:hypothetical protein [Bacillota bacterium]
MVFIEHLLWVVAKKVRADLRFPCPRPAAIGPPAAKQYLLILSTSKPHVKAKKAASASKKHRPTLGKKPDINVGPAGKGCRIILQSGEYVKILVNVRKF